MLLVVTPTPEETEKLRRTFAKLHTFVYTATYNNFLRATETYKPTAILLKVTEDAMELLVKKMEKAREIIPTIALITISDTDVSALAPDLKYSLNVQNRTLQFQGNYFYPPSPKDSLFMGSYIISGLLMVPFDYKIFLCGHLFELTPEEVFLLRYLVIIHPRRASAEELGTVCFSYGKTAPRSTVASLISRINKKAARIISVPIITHRPNVGYGIEF